MFTATVAVEVDSVATASGSAMNAIAGVGGYLFGQQSSNDPTPSSVLTFKVDPSRFQEALVALGSLGTIVEQQVSSDDVTEAVVDLQSRIAAAQTSVERLAASWPRPPMSTAWPPSARAAGPRVPAGAAQRPAPHGAGAGRSGHHHADPHPGGARRSGAGGGGHRLPRRR
ncbi:MAG: DUF4349 domain-containing protein [Acidimicrobiales bacterium]